MASTLSPRRSGSGPAAPLLPRWVARLGLYLGVGLLVAVTCWVLGSVLLRLALVSFTLLAAVLLTALLWPLHDRLKRWGWPQTVAALVTLLALLGLLAGILLLLWTRVSGLVSDLAPAATAGIDRVRGWLTSGPLHLDPAQISSLRNQVIDYARRQIPSPSDGARVALQVLTSLALALFAVFFFLKDGPSMWRWALERTPGRYRTRVDGAGHRAWATLSGYTSGVTLVAVADALLIGAALFILDVPLWLSLTLLTFLGAFVPILGATLSGVVAALVTLVTNGTTDAVIVVVVVLLVQQVEGNLLQPLLVGRAVHLHPVVTLVAVTSGFLLLGIAGAVLAVPLLAVPYQVWEFLRLHRRSRSGERDVAEATASAQTVTPGAAP